MQPPHPSTGYKSWRAGFAWSQICPFYSLITQCQPEIPQWGWAWTGHGVSDDTEWCHTLPPLPTQPGSCSFTTSFLQKSGYEAKGPRPSTVALLPLMLSWTRGERDSSGLCLRGPGLWWWLHTCGWEGSHHTILTEAGKLGGLGGVFWGGVAHIPGATPPCNPIAMACSELCYWIVFWYGSSCPSINIPHILKQCQLCSTLQPGFFGWGHWGHNITMTTPMLPPLLAGRNRSPAGGDGEGRMLAITGSSPFPPPHPKALAGIVRSSGFLLIGQLGLNLVSWPGGGKLLPCTIPASSPPCPPPKPWLGSCWTVAFYLSASWSEANSMIPAQQEAAGKEGGIYTAFLAML